MSSKKNHYLIIDYQGKAKYIKQMLGYQISFEIHGPEIINQSKIFDATKIFRLLNEDQIVERIQNCKHVVDFQDVQELLIDWIRGEFYDLSNKDNFDKIIEIYKRLPYVLKQQFLPLLQTLYKGSLYKMTHANKIDNSRKLIQGLKDFIKASNDSRDDSAFSLESFDKCEKCYNQIIQLAQDLIYLECYRNIDLKVNQTEFKRITFNVQKYNLQTYLQIFLSCKQLQFTYGLLDKMEQIKRILEDCGSYFYFHQLIKQSVDVYKSLLDLHQKLGNKKEQANLLTVIIFILSNIKQEQNFQQLLQYKEREQFIYEFLYDSQEEIQEHRNQVRNKFRQLKRIILLNFIDEYLVDSHIINSTTGILYMQLSQTYSNGNFCNNYRILGQAFFIDEDQIITTRQNVKNFNLPMFFMTKISTQKKQIYQVTSKTQFYQDLNSKFELVVLQLSSRQQIKGQNYMHIKPCNFNINQTLQSSILEYKRISGEKYILKQIVQSNSVIQQKYRIKFPNVNHSMFCSGSPIMTNYGDYNTIGIFLGNIGNDGVGIIFNKDLENRMKKMEKKKINMSTSFIQISTNEQEMLKQIKRRIYWDFYSNQGLTHTYHKKEIDQNLIDKLKKTFLNRYQQSIDEQFNSFSKTEDQLEGHQMKELTKMDNQKQRIIIIKSNFGQQQKDGVGILIDSGHMITLFNILYNKQNIKCTSAVIKSQLIQGWMKIDLDEIYSIKDQNQNFVLALIKITQRQLKKFDFPQLQFQLLQKEYRNSLMAQDQSINKQINVIFDRIYANNKMRIIAEIQRIKSILQIHYHQFFQEQFSSSLNFEGHKLTNIQFFFKILICRFTRLKQLNLNNNRIKDKGVYNLFHCNDPQLQFFNFIKLSKETFKKTKMQIQKKIVNQVESVKWPLLTKLYLENNLITNRGLIEISVYRCQIPMIQVVSLKNNKLTVAIQKTIKKNDIFWKTLQMDILIQQAKHKDEIGRAIKNIEEQK